MSSPTDYSKLKVTELREALQKRNLPTTGIKSELIARLAASDTSADAPSPASANKSHLPTADDYDVDWEDNDDLAPPAENNTATAASPAPAAASTPAPAKQTEQAGQTESAKTTVADTPAAAEPAKPKKKFTSIAALFDTPTAPTTTTPATAVAAAATPPKPKDVTTNSQSPSSPSTVTDEAASGAAAAATTSAPKAEEPSFAAGLSASNLDVELERRKARAKRFGIEEDATTTEATKKLEREKRFGSGAEESGKKEVVKGLDSALPEGRRERKRGAPVAGDNRGGKRARGGNNGVAGRGGQGQQGQRKQAPAAGVQKKGYRAVLDDPAEKAKAEARARKFGIA